MTLHTISGSDNWAEINSGYDAIFGSTEREVGEVRWNANNWEDKTFEIMRWVNVDAHDVF